MQLKFTLKLQLKFNLNRKISSSNKSMLNFDKVGHYLIKNWTVMPIYLSKRINKYFFTN